MKRTSNNKRPDIILNERGHHRKNLLVIEVKQDGDSDAYRSYDENNTSLLPHIPQCIDKCFNVNMCVMTDILDNAFGRFLVNVTVPFVKLYCRIFLCKDLRDNIFPVVGSVYYVGVSKAGAYHGTFFHKPQNTTSQIGCFAIVDYQSIIYSHEHALTRKSVHTKIYSRSPSIQEIPRIQTPQRRQEKLDGSYIRLPSAEKGTSDLIACSPTGQFWAIEVKKPSGKATSEQLEFVLSVKRRGRRDGRPLD